MKYKENKANIEPQEIELEEVQQEEQPKKSASEKLEDTFKKIIKCRLELIKESVEEIETALCKLDMMSSDESNN